MKKVKKKKILKNILPSLEVEIRKARDPLSLNSQTSMTHIFGNTEYILGHLMLDEILLNILSEYLAIEDISRIDVAMCSKGKRQAFLTLVRSDKCVFDSGRRQRRGYISWIGLLCIHIKQLICDPTLSREELLEVAHSGKWLQKLDLSYSRSVSDTILITIAESCPNLLQLNLSGCFKITDTSVIRIAKSCHNLAQLFLGGRNKRKFTNEWNSRIAQDCPRIAVCRKTTENTRTHSTRVVAGVKLPTRYLQDSLHSC
jgi:hypothetical protein